MPHSPYSILLSIALIAGAGASNTVNLGNLTYEQPFESLYIWPSGTFDKGLDLLEEDLAPGSVFPVALSPGKWNVLAFDTLGNAYALKNEGISEDSDSLLLGHQNILIGTPNLDHGALPLNVVNGLPGLSLDSIILIRDGGHPLILEDLRILSGTNAIIWLDSGHYRLEAFDEIGRCHRKQTVELEDTQENVLIGPGTPVVRSIDTTRSGAATASLEITNCIPGRSVIGVSLAESDGGIATSLDPSPIPPGGSVTLSVRPGRYLITAADAAGGRYSTVLEAAPGSTWVGVNPSMFEFDFGFPEGRL